MLLVGEPIQKSGNLANSNRRHPNN